MCLSQVWTFDTCHVSCSIVLFCFCHFLVTCLFVAHLNFRNSHDSDHLIMFKGCFLHWCDWQPVSQNLFIPGFDSILRLVHVKIQKIYINLSILFMVQKSGSPVEFGSFSHYLRGSLHPSWVTTINPPDLHWLSTRTRQGVANDRMRHCTWKCVWKFNSSPLKMCHSKRKVLVNLHCSGASC